MGAIIYFGNPSFAAPAPRTGRVMRAQLRRVAKARTREVAPAQLRRAT